MKNKKEILTYAFRYALGRTTVATSIVVETLIDEWEDLLQRDKDLIRREIKQAIKERRAGMDMDVETWSKILEL